MINSYKRSYKAEGVGVNKIDCEIFYSKGGYSYFTYTEQPRGYYFSIQPLHVEDCGSYIAESFSAFSGEKGIVLPCQRQSKKRYEEAKAMMDGLVDKYLTDFCNRKNIKLLGSEYEERECQRRV